MDKEKGFIIKNSQTTSIGRFDVVYDTIEKDGKESPYSYVKMKRGVGVFAMTGDSVILLRQYRYIWDDSFWEIPAGMVEDDEDPKVAAVRELEEETGYKALSIKYLGKCYPSIGSTTEVQYLYFAQCDKNTDQKLDPTEKIEIELIAIDKFKDMIKNGEFCHGMGLAAYSFLKEQIFNQ